MSAERRFAAGNPAQHFVTEFGDARIRVAPNSSAWELGLRTAALDCNGAIEPVESIGEPVTPSPNRVEARRQVAGREFTEWYVNGPLGLEQGFVFEQPPCRSADRAVIRLESTGLTPRPGSEGLELVDASGDVKLRYGQLSAEDATGRALPARLAESHGSIELEIALAGARFPVIVDPLLYAGEKKLVSSVAQPDEHLGRSVAVSGDTILGGAWGGGSATVFVRSGSTWAEQQKLVAQDLTGVRMFGFAASLSGNTALVGAHESDAGANAYQGVAYAFVRSGSTWTEQHKFVSADGVAFDEFGWAVAIDGNTAVIGSDASDIDGKSGQGTAYVYVRSGSTWTFQQKLLADDGQSGDFLGRAVAVQGDTAVVGSFGATVGANSLQGAAYVFIRSGTTWTQQGKLVAPDGVANDQFGTAVALDGDTALVQATANFSRVRVYSFVRASTTWSFEAKVIDTGPSGDGLDLQGNLALAGGAIYERSAGAWSWKQDLRPGSSMAIDGDVAAVGEDWADANRGAVYAYVVGPAEGDPCNDGTECASGICVDSRCCNVACTGACAACSLAAGASADGVCTIFQPGHPGSPVCGTLACNGSSLDCTSCTTDAQCPTGRYCSSGGSCEPQKPQGDACSSAGDCTVAGCRVCATGFCVDGVCCASACGGTCEACSSALTDLPNGDCEPIPADQDPGNECEPEAEYPKSCQQDGACDGARACRRYAKVGTPCGDTTCSAGSVEGFLCNGTGTCRTDAAPCAPYDCDGAACGTSCTAHSDCNATTGYCTSGGTCATRRDNGQSCTDGAQCASGHCIDDVCCESGCDAQCAACNVTGSEGTCIPIAGVPRGDRSPCSGGSSICGGSCDGVDIARCSYAPATTACDSSCDSGRETVSTCDGNGACSAGTPRDCDPYACGSDACLTSCSGDTECASGYRCEAARCIPDGERCSDDLSRSIPATGVAIDCAPFLCDESSGSCRVLCNVSSECAPGSICDTVAKTCAPPLAGSSAESGCGCRLGSESRERGGLRWLVLGALFALAATARRSSGSRRS